MAVTQIPADHAGDEEQEPRKADREDALIRPAWTSRPHAAVLAQMPDSPIGRVTGRCERQANVDRFGTTTLE